MMEGECIASAQLERRRGGFGKVEFGGGDQCCRCEVLDVILC